MPSTTSCRACLTCHAAPAVIRLSHVAFLDRIFGAKTSSGLHLQACWHSRHRSRDVYVQPSRFTRPTNLAEAVALGMMLLCHLAHAMYETNTCMMNAPIRHDQPASCSWGSLLAISVASGCRPVWRILWRHHGFCIRGPRTGSRSSYRHANTAHVRNVDAFRTQY